jgi:hypothetical protein
MNAEINKNDWKNFFENLSKRRFEWRTRIEVLSPETGDQVLSDGLPLNGVTMETVGDDIRIDLSVGENTNRHLTHNIVNPSRVAFLKGNESHGDVIDIEEANGTKTLITFIGAMELMVGIMETEMSITAG